MILPVILAACAAPEPASQAPSDTCGLATYEYLRGQHESKVMAINFTQPARIIGPRDQVTLDFLPERINFATDASGIVVGITCG